MADLIGRTGLSYFCYVRFNCGKRFGREQEADGAFAGEGMKGNKNIFLKFILRKPIISLLIALLVGLVSYGFVGKAVETILIWRETNRLESYYRSIGFVVKKSSHSEKGTLFSEAADIVRQSEFLAYDDLPIQAAGVMHDYYNVDYDYGTMDIPETDYIHGSEWTGQGVFNLDYWFYGTLINITKHFSEVDAGEEIFSGYMLVFNIDEVLAGYPKNIIAGENYAFWIPRRYTPEIDQMMPSLDKMKKGNDYLIRAFHRPYGNFAVRDLEVPVINALKTLNLKALDGKNQWYIELEKDERLNLNLPEYRELKLEIDRLKENLRALLLIGSSDMSAMPDMQVDAKRNFLVEGRWLNHDDELNANKVIVISKKMAKSEKIKLGDQITFTIRSLKNPYYAYIRVREDIENWKSYPSQEITYEVVGIYSSSEMEASFQNQNYFSNSYVPKSTLPNDFALPDYSSGIKDMHSAYSFVLDDPKNQDAFISESTSKLNEAGFSLAFSDNNGRNFKAGAVPLRRSALIGLLLLTFALMMAIAFTVFLYSRQHRKNYAILRALGVPEKSCARQLVFPLMALGIIGSGIGTLLSWKIAHVKALDSLSLLPLPSGVSPELNLHPVLGVLFWLFVIGALAIGACIGNRKMSALSIFALLQDSGLKVKQKTEQLDRNQEKPRLSTLLNMVGSGDMHGSENPNKAIVRFTQSSILRARTKSLLTILLPAALLFAVGWLQNLISMNNNEIDRLYESTIVQVDLTGPESMFTLHTIPHDLAYWMKTSSFIQGDYLSKVYRLPSKFSAVQGTFSPYPPYTILAINNMDYALNTRTAKMLEIEFAPGVGPEIFAEDWTKDDKNTHSIPLIVPETIMEEQNWEFGTEILFGLKESTEEIPFKIQGTFEKIALVLGDSGTTIDNKTIAAGYVPMLSNLSALELYTPNSLDYFEVAFYTEPKMNRRLDEFKVALEEKKEELSGYAWQTTVKFWDEELHAVVKPMEKNLSLMEKIYPFTMVISGVIGGILALILILYQSKEAALLKMMGVSQSTINKMHILQIMVLTVVGLLIGMIALVILKRLGALNWSIALAGLVYLGFTLMGAFVGSFQVFKKPARKILLDG